MTSQQREDVEAAPTAHAGMPIGEEALREALSQAEEWAERGNTETSRAYWSGMRDTLRVVLGLTTTAPSMTGPDADIAAFEILGGQRRHNLKRQPR